eukprot:Gb_03377 [translate_table: standard]
MCPSTYNTSHRAIGSMSLDRDQGTLSQLHGAIVAARTGRGGQGREDERALTGEETGEVAGGGSPTKRGATDRERCASGIEDANRKAPHCPWQIICHGHTLVPSSEPNTAQSHGLIPCSFVTGANLWMVTIRPLLPEEDTLICNVRNTLKKTYFPIGIYFQAKMFLESVLWIGGLCVSSTLKLSDLYINLELH